MVLKGTQLPEKYKENFNRAIEHAQEDGAEHGKA
jgi:hypothetical protein